MNISGSTSFFDLSSSDITNMTILELSDLTMTSSGDFIAVDETSDLNTLIIKNSVLGITFADFYDSTTLQDNYLSFDFNNVDADYILFRDLNLNLNSFGSTNSLLQIDANSDLNDVFFRTVTIDINNGKLITFTGNTNYDSVDIDFMNSSVTASGSAKGFNFSDGNYDTITISNVGFTSTSNYEFFYVDANIANLNLLDSNVDVSALFYHSSDGGTISDADLNFSGSNITVSNSGSYVFAFSPNTSTYGDFNIYNLVLTAIDESVFYFGDSDIGSLNITDSNLYLDAFTTLDNNDYNVLSGTIYNNIIIDSNTSNTFISANIGQFAADFNTSAQENSAKRTVWLTADDSDYIGGNLYLSDQGGANLYTTDSVSPFGIYDSTVTLLGSDENYTDSLALVAYTTPVNNDSPGGGGGGGGSSSSYEFVAESSASDDNFYVGTKIKVTLKESDSIAIIPNVDVNLTSPDGNVKTYKTNASGYFEFTPELDGNYAVKYKTNKDKTTITVLSASLAPKETVVEPVKTEPVKETPTKKTETTKTEIQPELPADTNAPAEEPVVKEGFNWLYVGISAVVVIIALIIGIFLLRTKPVAGQMF